MARFPQIVACRSTSGEERRFCFRLCTPEDRDRILELQEHVIAALPEKSLFVRTSQEEIEESLTRDFCLGAFYGEESALFTIMVANRVSPRNLGTCLGYDEAALLRTVTYDTTFVSPRHRGFGLQRLSCRFKDEAAREIGAAEALATVSPENTASLNNVKRHGFQIVERRVMYGGVDRLLLRKDLLTPGEKGGGYGLRDSPDSRPE